MLPTEESIVMHHLLYIQIVGVTDVHCTVILLLEQRWYFQL